MRRLVEGGVPGSASSSPSRLKDCSRESVSDDLCRVTCKKQTIQLYVKSSICKWITIMHTVPYLSIVDLLMNRSETLWCICKHAQVQ